MKNQNQHKIWQENLSDLIRDEKDSPEKDEIKIYEKTPKRILILIGKIISVVGCFCSILGIVYFVLKIFEYGFYYLFLIGSLVSIAGLGVSVYGCYKLWKKNKNPKTFVDSWQKTENAAELLDEKTILLEDEDDRDGSFTGRTDWKTGSEESRTKRNCIR